MSDTATHAQANRRTVLRLAMTAVAMFGFGYAMVPLYGWVCDVTGFDGRTGRTDIQQVRAGTVDDSRWVTVEFTGQVNSALSWDFKPMQKSVRVHPGETMVAHYYVRNNTSRTIIGQAVPNVVPSRAAPYFKKLECFCFTQQTLLPNEQKEMPVQFVVEPGLSPDVDNIVLSYTFFGVDKVSGESM